MQITKRHNLEELIKMGYIPKAGEKFTYLVGRKEVEFVALEEKIVGRSTRIENGKSTEMPPTYGKGVLYKDHKGRTCHLYQLTFLSKEVTYEVNFK